MVVTKDTTADIPQAHGDEDEQAASEAAHLASVQPMLDLSAWDQALADMAIPYLLTEGKNAIAATVETLKAQLSTPTILPSFDVVDRSLPATVKAQALKFAKSTNDTTSKKLSDALDELRGQLLEGLTTGDTRTQMRNRVMDVFEEMDRDRATMIAHTESSNARHAAQVATVGQSGVVQGKAWLASADACDRCLSYAAQGTIPLDKPFDVVPYGPIMHPAGHPLCFCSLTYPLKSPAEIDAAGIANAGKNLRLKENPNHDQLGHFSSGGAGGLAGAAEESESGSGGGDRSSVRSQRAKVGDLHPAKREGSGKDARIVMADGSPTPAHITAGMIPPAYSNNIQISKDAGADVWAKSQDSEGNTKTVYNPKFEDSNADIKWGRAGVAGVEKIGAIRDQIHADRSAGRNVNEADAAWLMSEQATRPGSEADTKGNKALWEHPIGKENVIVTPAKDGKGVPKVALSVGGETIPVRDEGAREEIVSRLESGKSLENSGFWLKSHGATTLEGRHVVPDGVGGAKLQFMGKEGVWHDHQVGNPALAQMLLGRKAKAGDRGSLFGTNDTKTAKYVGKLGEGNFSPKDLRTIRANEIADKEIGKGKELVDENAKKEYIGRVAAKVSGVLGNRPQQALSTYIDPAIINRLKVKT